MSDVVIKDVRASLDSVREAIGVLFDALIEPYETLAASDPDAVLGAPASSPIYMSPVSVRALAERIEQNGRSAWALGQVEERESQVRELLGDYRKGLYANTTAVEWLSMLGKFREAVMGDVNTAMQAPKSSAQIRLASPNSHPPGFDKDVLTPKDVAPQLGIDERTVRRRITDGHLGPWRKQGRKWVISRDAFLRYWDQLASDSDMPRPPGSSGEAADKLDHLHL